MDIDVSPSQAKADVAYFCHFRKKKAAAIDWAPLFGQWSVNGSFENDVKLLDSIPVDADGVVDIYRAKGGKTD
jgi:hypothetical protein